MRWPEQVEAGDLTEASCGPVRYVGWVHDVGGRIVDRGQRPMTMRCPAIGTAFTLSLL